MDGLPGQDEALALEPVALPGDAPIPSPVASLLLPAIREETGKAESSARLESAKIYLAPGTWSKIDLIFNV